jgi:hypothetical protein
MCANRQTADESITYKNVVPRSVRPALEIDKLPATALFNTESASAKSERFPMKIRFGLIEGEIL